VPQRSAAADGGGGRAGEIERNLIAGVEVTERELLNVFQRHGIRKIEAVGPQLLQGRFGLLLGHLRLLDRHR